MRSKIGTKQPDFDPAKEEISSHFKKTNDRFDKLVESANAVIQKAGAAGAGPEIQEIRDRTSKSSNPIAASRPRRIRPRSTGSPS